MLMLTVKLEGQGAFAGIEPERTIHLAEGTEIVLAGLAQRMESGKPSVAFGFPLPDGRWVIAETSLRLLLTAAELLKARYGDPR